MYNVQCIYRSDTILFEIYVVREQYRNPIIEKGAYALSTVRSSFYTTGLIWSVIKSIVLETRLNKKFKLITL